MGERKDLKYLGAWAEYLPGGGWDELVCWAEQGGACLRQSSGCWVAWRATT